MRVINLYWDRPNNRLIQGLNAASPLVGFEVVQNTELQIFVHDAIANTATPRVPAYTEGVLQFVSMRAAIGVIGEPPESGTFCLQVGADVTAPLTWPSNLSSPTLIATWKATVLAAVNALGTVGAGQAISVDPPNAPGNMIYIAWTNPANTAPITVVNNELIPWVQATVLSNTTPVGFTQIIKLAQFADAITTNFVRPMPPPATIAETVHGATGTNEEQTLVIPAAATGSISLTWSGATTVSMDVATITAAGIAAALNAIVPNGSSNPSFAVTPRTTTDGSDRFAIAFTGPLASAAQPELVVNMVDQQGSPWAVGIMDLTGNVGIEEALNGGTETTLTFELAINADGTGEDKVLQALTVYADLTDAETVAEAAAVGAIATVTNTVYVNTTTSGATVTAAAGAAINLVDTGVAGTVYTLTHTLDTINPRVEVQYKFSTTPEYWRSVPLGSWVDAVGISVTQVTLTFTVTLSLTTTDPYWIGNFRVFIYSPDSTIQLFVAQVSWDDCLQTVPGGTTLTAELAALSAQIGALGGGVTVSASNITGLIEPGNIDLNALADAVTANAEFLVDLAKLIATPGILQALDTAFLTDANFLTTLTTLMSNINILNAVAKGLPGSEVFSNMISSIVSGILGGGAVGALPPGGVLFAVPSFAFAYPPCFSITLGTVTHVEYGLLSPALPTFSNGGAITGDITYAGIPELVFTVAGTATVWGSEGTPRGRQYNNGDILGWDGNHWYRVIQIGAIAYPSDYEQIIWSLNVSAAQLYAGSQFVLQSAVTLQMLTPSSNDGTSGACTGSGFLVVETGAYADSGAGLDLTSVTWTAIATQKVALSNTAVIAPVNVKVTNPTAGPMSAGYTFGPVAYTACTAPANAFALRLRFTQFDVDIESNPRGQVKVSCTDPIPTISQVS